MVAVQSKTEAIAKKDYLKAESRLLTERERRFEMLEILEGEMKAGNEELLALDGEVVKLIGRGVCSEDICGVISLSTGISVGSVTVDEIRNMEDELSRRIVGQDEAIGSVCRAIRRAQCGLRDPSKTIANLMFAGSTGVGKTEVCKVLVEYYFGAEKEMLRFDMSEIHGQTFGDKTNRMPTGVYGI